MDNPKKSCKKCHEECISAKKIKDVNSNINIVYAPHSCTLIARDDDELRLRVWSFMRPPKISSPTPIINPCRLEKVRNLLHAKQNLRLSKLDCIGIPEECEQIVEKSRIEYLEEEASKNLCCRKIQYHTPQQRHSQKRYRPFFNNPVKNCCQRDIYPNPEHLQN